MWGWEYWNSAKEKFHRAKDQFYVGCYFVKELTLSLGSNVIYSLDASQSIRNYFSNAATQIYSGGTHAYSGETFERLEGYHQSFKILSTSIIRNTLLMLTPAILFGLWQQSADEEHPESHHDFLGLEFNTTPVYLICTYILAVRYLQMQRNISVYYNKAITNKLTEEMPQNRLSYGCKDGTLASFIGDANSLIYFAGDLAILFGVEMSITAFESMLRKMHVLDSDETISYHSAIFFSTFLMRSYVFGKSLIEYRVTIPGEVCINHREQVLLKNNLYSLVYGSEYLITTIVFDEMTRAFGIGNFFASSVFSTLLYQYFMAAALLIDELPGKFDGIDWLQLNHLLIDKAVESSSTYILDHLRNRTPKIQLHDIAKSSAFRYAMMVVFFEDVHNVESLVKNNPAFYYYLMANKEQWRVAIKEVDQFRKKGLKSWFNTKSWVTYFVYYTPSMLFPEKYQSLQKVVGALLSDKTDDVMSTVKKLLNKVDEHTKALPPIVNIKGEIHNIVEDYDDKCIKPEDSTPVSVNANEATKEQIKTATPQQVKQDFIDVKPVQPKPNLSQKKPEMKKTLYETYDDMEFLRLPTPKKTTGNQSLLFRENYKGPSKTTMKKVPSTHNLSDEEGWETIEEDKPKKVADVRKSNQW